jgi:hypothetical protein
VLREDYLIRMASQFAEVMARVLGLARSEEYEPALAAIGQSFEGLFGLSEDLVRRLPARELIAMLRLDATTPAWRERCALMAALLEEQGGLEAARGRHDESRACCLKALNIVIEIADGQDLPEQAPRIDDLIAALAERGLPAETRAGLVRHHEQAGAYARAEDALFAWLEAEPGSPAAIAAGLELYARLLARSDEALVAGNLPRDEVAAGLGELRALQRAVAGSPG